MTAEYEDPHIRAFASMFSARSIHRVRRKLQDLGRQASYQNSHLGNNKRSDLDFDYQPRYRLTRRTSRLIRRGLLLLFLAAVVVVLFSHPSGKELGQRTIESARTFGGFRRNHQRTVWPGINTIFAL